MSQSQPEQTTVARQVYERGIKAWLADRDAGRCLSTEFWEPREYIIRAIAETLSAVEPDREPQQKTDAAVDAHEAEDGRH